MARKRSLTWQAPTVLRLFRNIAGETQQIVGPEPRAACFASSVIRRSCSVAPWPGQLNRCALSTHTEMNACQWGILIIAFVIFGLSELFPPWTYHCDKGFTHPAGYSWRNNPPLASDYICPTSDKIPPIATVVKDSGRLFCQRTTILTVAAGLLLLMKRRRTKFSIAIAALVLFVALLSLCLLLFGVWLGF